MTDPKLCPCPWCLQPPYHAPQREERSRYHVWCDKCDAQGPAAGSREAAIGAWNTPKTEREGWKLVPVEADGAMKMAGSAAPASAARNAATNTLERQFETVADIYRACVAMAPATGEPT